LSWDNISAAGKAFPDSLYTQDIYFFTIKTAIMAAVWFGYIVKIIIVEM